jgi:glycosyltransferase involved in cell wall biosynthesis
MRIAEISTLFRPVPPPGEGSVESIVHILTEGLVRRGHEVTLYATADSMTTARLESPVEESYSTDTGKWDWQLYEAFQVRRAFLNWIDFDVIHCHSYHFGLLFCDFVPVPSLHSIHIEPGPDYRFLAARTANRHFHFCSKYQARDFGEEKGVHVIPHGTTLTRVSEPGEPVQDYVAFLGRFIPEKGPLDAIRIARRAGIPVKLAAPMTDYYREFVEPEVDGTSVEYVGEVKGEEKARFLSRAKALLYPIQTPEPFGLVLVEALACGTPVVSLARGAISEIVEHGRDGWLGETEDDLVKALPEIDRLDRRAIRENARKRFDADVMIDRIESLLDKIVEGYRR